MKGFPGDVRGRPGFSGGKTVKEQSVMVLTDYGDGYARDLAKKIVADFCASGKTARVEDDGGDVDGPEDADLVIRIRSTTHEADRVRDAAEDLLAACLHFVRRGFDPAKAHAACKAAITKALGKWDDSLIG